MTPCQGNIFLFSSYQQSPHLRHGPLKGFLSWHSILLEPSTRLVLCVWNYGETRTPAVRCALLGAEVPETPPRTTDANLDCAFVEDALFDADLWLSRVTRIELSYWPDWGRRRVLRGCGVFWCWSGWRHHLLVRTWLCLTSLPPSSESLMVPSLSSAQYVSSPDSQTVDAPPTIVVQPPTRGTTLYTIARNSFSIILDPIPFRMVYFYLLPGYFTKNEMVQK